WQLIDSAGYNISPFQPSPYYGPGQVDPGDLELNYHFNANNKLESNRFNAYLQYNKKWETQGNRFLINFGIRGTYWDYNEEFNLSPRAQFAIKPNWITDQLFRLSAGLYVQSPFYKELRTPDGELNKN